MSTLGKFLKLYKQLNVEYKREIAYIRYFQYVCAQRPAGEKVLYLGKLLHKSLLFKVRIINKNVLYTEHRELFSSQKTLLKMSNMTGTLP